MSIEERLLTYKKSCFLEPEEDRIQETVRKSQACFYQREEERVLSYREFLWTQLKMLQKRWWALQFLILCLAALLFVPAYDEYYTPRGAGVLAAVFIILLIPEFWKNQTCRCLEIEEASYFSLRQVYAARMVLFGGADLLLLTGFGGVLAAGFGVSLHILMVQFLLPLLVTAGICFGILCGRRRMSQAAAVAACLLWSSVWSLVVLSDRIYERISGPVWAGALLLAAGFLAYTLYRTLKNSSEYWEVSYYEAGTE